MPVTINGTTGIAGVDGSAGTPAVQGADTNTGMFFPAADTIAFAEGGAEAMRIDSSGNVGIGTSSPVARLNVSVADGGGVVISNTNDTHTGALSFGDTSANSSGRISYDHSSNALRFDTNGSERARINTSGDLLVNTTSSGVSAKFQVTRSGGTPAAIHNSGGTSGFFNQILFLNNAGTADIGYISRTNDNTTTYNTTSDYRLKENIKPMAGALARVALLKPCTYTWKSDGSAGEGFVAHELQEVVPAAVTGEKDAVKEDGSIKPQGIDTSFLVATLTAAIQEQQALIESLTARIAALEGAK